jgi:hypothetical protein
MIKRLERLKNTVNKYMAGLRPDRFTTYQSSYQLVVSRRPGVITFNLFDTVQGCMYNIYEASFSPGSVQQIVP